MRRAATFVTFALLLAAGPALAAAPAPRAPTEAERARYGWLDADAAVRPLSEVFAPPPGAARVAAPEGSFAAWLRDLPLRPADAPVLRYDGALLHGADDPRVAAVAEIDVGAKDLQQCADFIIRLHAEWLWSAGRADEAAYRFTSGDEARWTAYARGERPKIRGRKVTWSRAAKAARDRATFRKYLDLVFMYAGTASLARDADRVKRGDLAAGDFFVLGGHPGHAVVVLDVAEAPGGRRYALIGQGFLPARDLHVLASGERHDPWFDLSGDQVATPFWQPFPWSSLRRL